MQVEKRAKLDIYYQIDEYIKSKERKVSKATLTVYGNIKYHLLAFESFRNKKITFNSFDFTFYEDFVDYLTFEHIHLRRKEVLTGLCLNTIGKTINTFAGLFKKAMLFTWPMKKNGFGLISLSKNEVVVLIQQYTLAE